MTTRRRDDQYFLLEEHLHISLSCMYELQSYALYLQSSPAIFSCLLHADADAGTTSRVLEWLKDEWRVVEKMEKQDDTRHLLLSLCPYVKNQTFRELHCFLAKCKYEITHELLALISSWYPRFTGSANVEQVFQSMERSVRQAGCSNSASLPSLMSIGLRCLSKRLCCHERSPEPISLDEQDFEGLEVRALKDRIWRPSNASNCHLLVA